MALSNRHLIPAAFVGGLGVLLLVSACSGGDSSDEAVVAPAPAPTTAPGTTAQPSQSQTAPAQQTSSTGGCEELGNITGTSLTANLPNPTVRSFSLPLTNRPTATKVAVIGIGTPADLEGKTVALGAGDNANYSTCTHCFIIAVGCTTDCTQAVMFYAKSGNATFTSVADAANEKFSGTMTDVTLEEVRVDFDTTVSTPVPNGACFHVQTLTFDATAKSTTSLEGDGGGGGGGGGKKDGGGGGGEDSGTSSTTDSGTTDSGTTSSSSGGTGSSGGSGGGGGGADAKAAKIEPF